MDLITIRTALIITLSILLVVVIFRRFRRSVLAKDVPAPSHAELLLLDVEYHPSRLRVVMEIPHAGLLQMTLLDGHHQPLHMWDKATIAKGRHDMQLALPALEDGAFYFEVSTTTQRTVRGFRLKQA